MFEVWKNENSDKKSRKKNQIIIRSIKENKNYKYPTPYSSHTCIILGQGFGYYTGKWENK